MAQRTGMTVKMDNSDDTQRKYNIICEVTVEDNTATDVHNLVVTKEGMQVAHGSMRRISKDMPDVSLNINNLPLAEHTGCIAAVYAFVDQAVKEVMETE